MRSARSLTVALGLVATIGIFAPAHAAPHWDRFEDKGCSRNGIRLWESTLQGAGDWDYDCAHTPAAFQASGITQRFSRPSQCVKDTFHVWGRFDVADDSCRAHWGNFEKRGCVAWGLRLYESTLQNAHDWIPDCNSTPATISEQAFNRPTRCLKDLTHVWGQFNVRDGSCPSYRDFNASCTAEGVRTYRSTLEEIPPGMSWEAACTRATSDVGGKTTRADRCVNVSGLRMEGQFDRNTELCATSRPVGVCSFTRQAGLTVDSATVTGAEMALFVVAPNHKDMPDAGNLDAEAVESIAARIHDSWKGDPRKLVIAISDTGGCRDCGSPATAVAAGSAHTLANRLHALYGIDFKVKRAIPRLPTDYVAMPAIVSGGEWDFPDGVNFIGKDHAHAANITDGGKRYARTVLTRRSDGFKLGLSVVHLSVDSESNRKYEVIDMLDEAAGSGDLNGNIIAGDFNHALSDYAAENKDSDWVRAINALRPAWKTSRVACTLEDGSQTSFYDDILNAVYLPKRPGVTLMVSSMFYDRGGQAGPSGHMRVRGVAHPILGMTLTRARRI